MKSLPVILLVLVTFSSCQEDQNPKLQTTLSDGELKTLLYMREEEKLAHDVYVHAFNKYGVLAFQNIANSESQHVQAVINLMNSYQIQDPLNGSSALGEYTITEIQSLYPALISKVNESKSEALLVGMLIEDLDIDDLDNAIFETNNTALNLVYENLKCGSKNHLRTFEDLASLAGLSYSPAYISQTDYENIINSPRTTCNN